MSEFFKSYEILSGDIETYSNTARDTGTIPNVYIYGKNYSSILKKTRTRAPSVCIVRMLGCTEF